MKHYILALVMLISGCSYLAPLVGMLPSKGLSVEAQVGKENTHVQAFESEQVDQSIAVDGDNNYVAETAASNVGAIRKVTAKKVRSVEFSASTNVGVATGEQSQAVTVGDNSKVVINQGLDPKVLGGILGGIIFIPMLAYTWRERK